MLDAFAALREHGVQVLTVGQYLRPSERHLPVVRYWHPDEFAALERAAYELGFDHVAAGPLVRSSYHADQHVRRSRRRGSRTHSAGGPQRLPPRAARIGSEAPAARRGPAAMFPLKDNIPLARFPIITVALVAINVIAYLLEIRHGGSFFGGPTSGVEVHYGAIPYELTHPGKHCGLITAANARRPVQHGRLSGPARRERQPGTRSRRPGRRCSRRCSCTPASCTSSAT